MANISKNKDLRESESQMKYEQVVTISSGIPLSQIFVSKVICIKITSITTSWGGQSSVSDQFKVFFFEWRLERFEYSE